MPKNIVICADGTGNSGGTTGVSNVWRLYQAVDLETEEEQHRQIAFHDDGVGTQSLKFIKMLGMGTGFGLSSNLAQLYAYLVRHFEEGDRIFLFGFSRGAFTVRALANILYFCGIASNKKHGENGDELLSPDELADLADRAVSAHRLRNWRDPDDEHSEPFKFRKENGLVHRAVAEKGDDLDYIKHDKGRFPITFVGVWDTVAAVGLPFDEMTQYCLNRAAQGKSGLVNKLFGLNRLFGHVLRRDSPVYNKNPQNPNWEDDAGHVLRNTHLKDDSENPNPDGDVQPFIRKIFHAVSTDDERYTFHPTLLLEDGAAAQANAIIEQVWFAGVHANVGGGYPKDGLAFVALRWMMHHAHEAGLIFNADVWTRYREESDPHGPLYDSRAVAGRFYRYRPRDLGTITSAAGLRELKLHPSVLDRIKRHSEDYAPTGIPATYTIAAAPELGPADRRDGESAVAAVTSVPKENPDKVGDRINLQERVEDLIWWRRVLYYVFVIWVVIWLGVNFLSESVFAAIAWVVGYLDQHISSECFTRGWWVFTGLAAASIVVFHILRRNAKNHDLNSIRKLRRIFFWEALRDTAAIVCVVLIFHNPITTLLNWALPSILTPLVDLLSASPLVSVVLVVGSNMIRRSSIALRTAITTTQFTAWDTTLESNPPTIPDIKNSLFLKALHWVAGLRGQPGQHGFLMRLKRRYAPFVVFWSFVLVVGLGILTAVSSTWVRFNTAGERLARTSDSLEALAELVPHETISFTLIDEVNFNTNSDGVSRMSLTKGKYYLVQVIPVDWDEPLPREDKSTGQLPSDLSGEHSGLSALTSADAAKVWGWKDNFVPATPEGIVESEMNLSTKLLMMLYAPVRRRASQPWFRLLGEIEGDPLKRIVPIGNSVIFQAPSDGKLIVYVNDVRREFDDAISPIGFYRNNEGEARIRIHTCSPAVVK
ncbi:MAG: DUF2235 domain-containing protein [Planctomycetota bacterium]|nr:DUF2235 domain-containing protein [Planctomycetota bacterium]